MAHFAAGKIASGENFSVNDDAAANACAERNGNGNFRAAQGAGTVFAESRRIRVVFENCLFARLALHQLLKGQVFKPQVVRKLNHAGIAVDGPGASNPNIGNVGKRQAGFPQCFVRRRRKLFADFIVGARDARFAARFHKELVRFVRNACRYVCSAEVDAQIVHKYPSFAD